jgi:hypothetical protein
MKSVNNILQLKMRKMKLSFRNLIDALWMSSHDLFSLLSQNIENTINHSVHTVGMMHHFRKPIKVDFPLVFPVQFVPQFINLHLCHVFSL